MGYILKTAAHSQTDHFLDITAEICPMTFVKTKLLIERMDIGQTAEVRLRGAEPLDNVPRSVREYGHEVLALDPEEPDGPADGVYRLLLRKSA